MQQVYGVPDGVMLHFRLNHAHSDTIPEMARYMHARDSFETTLGSERYVSVFLDHKPSQGYIDRARSFGWTQVSWRAGLPPAPIRVVTRRTSTGPRRGRPFVWIQTVIFDTQPTDLQLSDIRTIAEPGPRRDMIVEQTSCGVWEVSIWRDKGWTRTEQTAFWEHIARIGGRIVRDGDFGCRGEHQK